MKSAYWNTVQFTMKASANLSSNRRAVTGKTARTLICVVCLAGTPYVVPGLARFRSAARSSLSGLLEIRGHAEPSVTAGIADAGMIALAPSSGNSATLQGQSGNIQVTPGEIEDPSGHALDHFFSALLKSETKGGAARVCHYGDSPITNDGITSTIRQLAQLRFGDAGHGFILTAKPWGWYSHEGVTQNAGRGWESDPMFISRGDHLYGLGGVSFTTGLRGATATFGTADEGEVGRSVSSFDIYFLTQPGGGDLEIEVDGTPRETLATAGDATRSGFRRVNVEKGAHTLTLRAVGNGAVRVFGVALESDGRGIEYDSLGVNGAFIGLLAHYMDEQHWAEQLQHRAPDLVIVNYGTNESQFEKLPMDRYDADTREVIRRIRSALPEASIMFLAPMDRGERGEGGATITRPMIPKLVGYQRRIASEEGCAFFDTFTAMGGEGTVARWSEARPRLMGGDFTHPTAKGAEIVGTLIYNAMMRSYEKHKAP
jgi:lysophospholipase L1-like esterase